MNRWLALLLFIALTFGGGFVIGTLAPADAWYQALQKPWFNPPNWLFPIAWSVLYILIGIAGWRVWLAGDRRSQTIWWVGIVLNFLWSPTFFLLHQTGLALAVIAAMFVSIVAFIASAWRSDRAAAALFVPYAFWTAFAGLLNASILAMN